MPARTQFRKLSCGDLARQETPGGSKRLLRSLRDEARRVFGPVRTAAGDPRMRMKDGDSFDKNYILNQLAEPKHNSRAEYPAPSARANLLTPKRLRAGVSIAGASYLGYCREQRTRFRRCGHRHTAATRRRETMFETTNGRPGNRPARAGA